MVTGLDGTSSEEDDSELSSEEWSAAYRELKERLLKVNKKIYIKKRYGESVIVHSLFWYIIVSSGERDFSKIFLHYRA